MTNYRINEWDQDFKTFLKVLQLKKPIIICGDFNVANSKELDITNADYFPYGR